MNVTVTLKQKTLCAPTKQETAVFLIIPPDGSWQEVLFLLLKQLIKLLRVISHYTKNKHTLKLNPGLGPFWGNFVSRCGWGLWLSTATRVLHRYHQKIKTAISSPPVSSLWRWEVGLHFCATGSEGLVVPQLRTRAVGFPRRSAAAT